MKTLGLILAIFIIYALIGIVVGANQKAYMMERAYNACRIRNFE